MKTLLLLIVSVVYCVHSPAQSIVGKWQLVKQSNCVEDDLPDQDTDTDALVEDMKGMSSAGGLAQILEFKSNNTGQESTKIISRKKAYNSKSFLYKFNGEGLYILDKKSQTIIEGFSVEKFDADSLIITNSSRVCETKIFLRVK
ncbi:hypothetical protein [Chryseolinea lacunae]|uniref:Lipocalin-like domain-containing protein n=1 Tax=Chryseolinea lacunae TaxID=2801331 RepID=A0ABS1KSY2_9BACT|nr:hypothetical protein [Chryseolinea lacunae]MBL0742475.1 hypothetical protein [Chryseolinea lacunae]